MAVVTRVRGAHTERYRIAERRGSHRERRTQPLVVSRPDAYGLGTAVAVLAVMEGPR